MHLTLLQSQRRKHPRQRQHLPLPKQQNMLRLFQWSKESLRT
jgi:hypothetical protein